MSQAPYMPDEARARMPQSALQPLPPYLRKDFSQSVDKARPRELLLPQVKGKPADPKRLGCLQYRYLDTGETCTVPNVWYNQTQAMRVEHWEYEAKRTAENLAKAQGALAQIEASSSPYWSGKPREKALQEARWHVDELKRIADTCQATAQGVKAGTLFV